MEEKADVPVEFRGQLDILGTYCKKINACIEIKNIVLLFSFSHIFLYMYVITTWIHKENEYDVKVFLKC